MEEQTKQAVNRPKVAIILLNWNGWQDTIECLESVYQITYPNYDVIVVDNGSKDESIDKIREFCKGKIEVESNFFDYNSSNKPIKIYEYTKIHAEKEIREIDSEDLSSNRRLILIKNEKNYGFAKGSNIGFQHGINNGARYLFSLNNDTVVDKDLLENIVNIFESDDKIGIIGPTIYYYDEPDIINSGGYRINWWTAKRKPIRHEDDNNTFGEMINVDCVSGCAMIISDKLLNKVSMFDEFYTFGGEDWEFCARAIRNNFKVVNVPRSKVWHKISRSRAKLITNKSEHLALFGCEADSILKPRGLKNNLITFKLYSPTKIHYLSNIIFLYIRHLGVSLPYRFIDKVRTQIRRDLISIKKRYK